MIILYSIKISIMTNFYKCIFTFDDAQIEADILAALLGEIGFDSFDSSNNILNAYILENLYDEQSVIQVLDSYPFCHLLNWTKSIVEGKDWNEEWEKNSFKPIIIKDSCAIHSSAYDKFEGIKYDILINPKMSFGTGSHETTTLMIERLLSTELNGKKVLDVGTGTGILAILSSMMGANSVTGIELDPVAAENSESNLRLNNIENVNVINGDITFLKDGEENFDLVLANINRNILIHDMPYYASKLKAGGMLQLSGFYKEDVEILEDEANKYGLKRVYQDERNNWNILVLKKYKSSI